LETYAKDILIMAKQLKPLDIVEFLEYGYVGNQAQRRMECRCWLFPRVRAMVYEQEVIGELSSWVL